MGLGALIGGIVGGGLSLFGAKKSSDAMADQSRLTQAMLDEARLRQFSAGVNGGPSAIFNPQGGGTNSPYATPGSTLYERLASALAGGNAPRDTSGGSFKLDIGNRYKGQQGLFDSLGQQFLRQGSGTGTLSRLNQGLAGFAGSGADPTYSPALFSAILGNTAQASGQIGNSQALANAGYGVAAQQLQDVFGGGEAARARTLDTLRAQAAPFEERAFSGLQDNLFGTGRLGTTGGALQTEAFARGLGQADLQRQLAANAEGRAFTNNALNQAMGSSGMADSLLQNAFGNFRNLAGLADDVSNSMFRQNTYGQDQGFNQLQQIFQNQMGISGFGQTTRNQNFANAMSAFGFGNNLQDAALPYANLALQAEQLRSGTALGQAAGTSGIIPGGAYQGQFLGGLGGVINNFGAGGGFDFLGGLFGGSKTKAPSGNFYGFGGG